MKSSFPQSIRSKVTGDIYHLEHFVNKKTGMFVVCYTNPLRQECFFLSLSKEKYDFDEIKRQMDEDVNWEIA